MSNVDNEIFSFKFVQQYVQFYLEFLIRIFKEILNLLFSFKTKHNLIYSPSRTHVTHVRIPKNISTSGQLLFHHNGPCCMCLTLGNCKETMRLGVTTKNKIISIDTNID